MRGGLSNKVVVIESGQAKHRDSARLWLLLEPGKRDW